ncbi:MAG: thermonuclease family protein [Rhodomicrobiaceae bacterium]
MFAFLRHDDSFETARCFGRPRPAIWRAAIGALAGLVISASSAAAACHGKDGGESTVTGINAGETLILEDGRAVRIAGVLTPKRSRSGPEADARMKMETALASLVMGKKVSLHLDERERDRYGRVLAQIMMHDETGKPVWLQAQLVEAGLARVISFESNRLCVKALLAIESAARETEKGLWGSGFFAVRQAHAEDVLYRLARSYEIVEGRVSNVAQIKGRTYINFGDNWRRDFTAFIPSRRGQDFQSADGQADGETVDQVELKTLKGRHIRVRGWLKNYNGPSITVTHPEQIEILDRNAATLR